MEIFGIPLIDSDDFLKLIFKFSINLLFLFITIRFIFYRNNRDKDYLFTFFMFNLMTFFICVLLRKVPMEMGFAMGLFAVFGILRYRTEALPIKEMTYLFIVIGLAMINALTNKSISMAELLFTDFVIVGVTLGIELIWFNNHERSKTIVYEKIEMIKPVHNDELMADLRERTGLDVFKFTIGNVDFLKDVASIKIYYKEKK
jgi:hypothetical protein|tara:strand:- start:7500 stop:8105 length:606 start_codon:yes stop_codon:yes gene_type:complete